jgi:hypothetical protein
VPVLLRITKQALRDLACPVIAVVMAAATVTAVRAELVDSPKFQRGLWQFDRVLEYPDAGLVTRHDGIKRCVDPTTAMKGIFASPSIGSCRSSAAERVDNQYTFANRCDYLGPVRTEITVHSAHAYTELNVSKAGNFRAVDTVSAKRLGDCDATQ